MPRPSPSPANKPQPTARLVELARAWCDARGLAHAGPLTVAGGRITLAALDVETDALIVFIGQDLRHDELLARLTAARTYADLVILATLTEPTATTAQRCKAAGVGIITPASQAYYLEPRRSTLVQYGHRDHLAARITTAHTTYQPRPTPLATRAELREAIELVVSQRPTATIAELWASIPNNYANPRRFERNLRAEIQQARQRQEALA